jgi:thiol-disulfide isomerase/thioredoxin
MKARSPDRDEEPTMFGFGTLRGLVVLWLGTLFVLIAPTNGLGRQETQDERQAPSEVEVRRELNRLLEDQTTGVPAAIMFLDSVLDKFPTDSDLYLMAISLNASHGTQLLSEERHEAAHVAIRRAETIAKAVLADPKHLQAAEPMLADAFFLAAQSYATDKNFPSMYAALDQACDLGFEPWLVIQDAKPFAEVLNQPEFQAYLDKQKKLVPERMALRLQQEIDNFQAFDFDFNLTSVTGEPMAKTQWKGKLLVVDVWGTWCGPCRLGLPHLIELQEKFREKGVQIVGLNVENEETVAEQLETVKAAIKEFRINYPCALIDNDFLESIPEFQGFPTTLLIDGTGRVRLRMVGVLSPIRLQTAVNILLEESKSDQP